MAYDFPHSPVVNDIFAPAGGPIWKWNGTAWTQLPPAAGVTEAPVDGLEYVRKNAAWVTSAAGAPSWASIIGKPSTFPPDAHVHPQSDVTNLTTDLAAKLNTSAYTAVDVLAKVKTVDGVASGLDADLLDGNDSAFYATAASVTGKEPTIAAGTAAQYWQGTKSWQTLDKAAVGLGSVDNTADTAKPVSTAQAAADALNVLKAGDTMTGNLTIAKASATLEIQKAASGEYGSIHFKTGSPAAGMRWRVASNATAESANAGSDFMITRFNDAGTGVENSLTINRLTGNMTLGQRFTGNNTGAPPAGGSVAIGLFCTSTANLGIMWGTGAPTVTAAKGSLYVNTTATTTTTRLYVNTDGAATWTNLTTAA